ncbi:matrixin family metalloprotease [Marmoricola sp. RAF53]|uniref:matrixin family metalloprotease n=1 Tax=Marmoricola sp. RAF53 TaxID=3233059 RepID=UPI003F9712A0
MKLARPLLPAVAAVLLTAGLGSTAAEAAPEVHDAAPDPVYAGPAAAAGTAAAAHAGGSGLFGARWNPCQPITYRVNPRGGYAGSVGDVRRAFEQVGAATGIRFVYRGTSNGIAFRGTQDRRADILVSWATPRQVPGLRGPVAGLASSSYAKLGTGVHENVQGRIALDRTARLRHGFPRSGATSWGQVYLHEIGHVMGLDHVGRRNQVMYPVVGPANHRFGAGDLRRLRQVGRSAGCISASARTAAFR